MTEDTDTDDDIPLGNLVILTADEILLEGLNIIGWDTSRVEKWKNKKALEHYRGMYGINPVVTAQLLEDLQTIGHPQVTLDSSFPLSLSFRA
jgi:hypothetical protein